MEKQSAQQPLNNNTQAGEDIIKGACNEDQLDRLRAAVKINDNAEEFGTPPGTGDENLHDKKTESDGQQKNQEDIPGGDKDLGGITNLSLDQLKREGDNNYSKIE